MADRSGPVRCHPNCDVARMVPPASAADQTDICSSVRLRPAAACPVWPAWTAARHPILRVRRGQAVRIEAGGVLVVQQPPTGAISRQPRVLLGLRFLAHGDQPAAEFNAAQHRRRPVAPQRIGIRIVHHPPQIFDPLEIALGPNGGGALCGLGALCTDLLPAGLPEPTLRPPRGMVMIPYLKSGKKS